MLEVSKKTFDRLWEKIQGRYIIESEDGALTVVNGFLRGKQRRIEERLTKNPLESELDLVEPITVKEFAAMIGYNESQMSRLEKAYSEVTFMCDGRLQHFCAFVDHGRNKEGRFVVINPRIFYAGKSHEQVDVLGLFFK